MRGIDRAHCARSATIFGSCGVAIGLGIPLARWIDRRVGQAHHHPPDGDLLPHPQRPFAQPPPAGPTKTSPFPVRFRTDFYFAPGVALFVCRFLPVNQFFAYDRPALPSKTAPFLHRFCTEIHFVTGAVLPRLAPRSKCRLKVYRFFTISIPFFI